MKAPISKPVNDTQGHAAGDELIRRAGRVLKLQVREADSVARVGGDEFAILVQGAYPASLQSVALRVGAALNLARVQASIGTRMAEMNSLSEVAADQDVQYAKQISQLQDIDYAEAISRFMTQQMQLQAAQQSFSKVSGMSLFNYL